MDLRAGRTRSRFTVDLRATSALQALSLSTSIFSVGTSASGTIVGATGGSTIVASGLPSGLTINGPARTWAWSGSGTPSSGTLTLTETLSGRANSPRANPVLWAIIPSVAGSMDFSDPADSGLLAIMEDI